MLKSSSNHVQDIKSLFHNDEVVIFISMWVLHFSSFFIFFSKKHIYISHPYCPQKINNSMIFLDEIITFIEEKKWKMHRHTKNQSPQKGKTPFLRGSNSANSLLKNNYKQSLKLKQREKNENEQGTRSPSTPPDTLLCPSSHKTHNTHTHQQAKETDLYDLFIGNSNITKEIEITKREYLSYPMN